jgi:hypothetical protein
MKFLPLASLTLVAPLLLTGCASSPSLEDQTKLVEYERCLEFQERRADRAIEIEIAYVETYERLVNLRNFEMNNRNMTFDQFKEACAQYRP